MASITVRNLDEGLKRRLRIRAAENGKSMEQEARDILRAALDESPAQPARTHIASAIRARVSHAPRWRRRVRLAGTVARARAATIRPFNRRPAGSRYAGSSTTRR